MTITLAPPNVDLDALKMEVSRQLFYNKLPPCNVGWGELEPNCSGLYDRVAGRIVIANYLQERPKGAKVAMIHEAMHLWIAHTYPIKQQRDGSHHSPAWYAECKRISWLMRQPLNVWKHQPAQFPLWSREAVAS